MYHKYKIKEAYKIFKIDKINNNNDSFLKYFARRLPTTSTINFLLTTGRLF